jgi:hypothetical protein
VLGEGSGVFIEDSVYVQGIGGEIEKREGILTRTR